MPINIKINAVLDDDAFLHDVESIDWSEIIKAEGTGWAKTQSIIEEMADSITEGVKSAPADSVTALNDFYSSVESEPYSSADLEQARSAVHDFYLDSLSSLVKDSFLSTEIDISEIEFCRKSPPDRIRALLKQRDADEFGQAMLLVLLEYFRPDFFSLDQQILTQGVVDLGRATELVEKLNAALMFCSGSYHVDDPAERAIIKHYLLKIIRSSSDVVNLRGQHHGGWFNITGIATGQKGEILKLMVEIDPFRAPPEMFNYYKP